MRTARPLGLTPDGASLLVVTTDGEQIAVIADERLRAAIRDDRPRLGQLEIDMESSLRPREIQARIRAGESVEDLAQTAGMPLERIRTFAGPVIAEREHVVGLALAAPVRRAGETAATRALRTTTSERLLARGIDSDDVTWDSWKRPDGLWTVVASYLSGSAPHQAHFTFDPRGRFSVATDDDARWLIGETTPAHGPQPGRRPRRESDPDNEPTVDLDDELAIVRATLDSQPAGPAIIDEGHDAPDVPDYSPAELEQVNGVYDLVPPKSEMDVLYDMISGIDEDSVRIYTGLSNPVTQDGNSPPAPEPARPIPSATRKRRSSSPAQAPVTPVPPPKPDPEPSASDTSPESLREPQQLSLMDVVEDSTDTVVTRVEVVSESVVVEVDHNAAPTDAPGPPTEERKVAPKRRRTKRASVPSWDEIMFGGPAKKD